MTRERYESLPLATLKELAKARNMKGVSTLKKSALIDEMLKLDETEKQMQANEKAKEEVTQDGKESNSEDEMLKLLPVAYHDIMAYGELDDDEKELLELWKKILGEAKQTEKYNPELNYGVYQITKELNTFTEEKKGKDKKKVYDYPQLNGDLNTLRTKLKEYYVSHIKEKMFKYQLIK